MADSTSRHSKNYRNERTEYRSSNSVKYKTERKSSNYECKTPPLAQKKSLTIDKLIKERESLKRKLKKMEKDLYSSENSKGNEEKQELHVKKKKYVRESSPEHFGDYNFVDSEDEEAIIEKRRKERKQLLEKLNDKGKETRTRNESFVKEKNSKDFKNNDNNINKHLKESKQITDMFAETDHFASSKEHVTQDNSINNANLTDNWDNPEGYYNITVGDMINDERYIIKSILGQGVFANVVRARDTLENNTDVAIKIIRNNDLMYRCGLKEVSILRKISEADPEGKYHCVKLFNHFMHKSHLCIVIEPLHMDLRCIIKKYGKNHGLNVKALVSYSRQLLLALRLLKKTGIIHADIKPDNILVNEKKNVLKLCDFGSATNIGDNEPTPYLVSRFYRAPEIILGLSYNHGVDLWSTACTMYEMATGKIMFPGSSNNKMLKCFMDLKGKVPNKLLKRGKFKDQHFNYNNHFLVHKKDEITNREKVVEVSNIIVKRDLLKELKKHCKSLDEERKMEHLRDLLDRMLTLDPNLRLSIVDCLKHTFIQEQIRK